MDDKLPNSPNFRFKGVRAYNGPDLYGREMTIRPEDTPKFRDLILSTLRKFPTRCGAHARGQIRGDAFGRAEFVLALSEYIERSQLILWDSSIYLSSMAGHESLAGLTPDLQVPFSQFWILNNDILVQTQDDSKAFGLFQEGATFLIGEIFLSGFLDQNNRPILLVAQFMHVASIQPPKSVDENIDRGIPRILFGVFNLDEPLTPDITALYAAMKFMQLPIVSTAPHGWTRPFRRRAEREGVRLPEVKVVRLRRNQSVAKPRDPNAEPFHYKQQFVVEHHWRKQYYPSTGERKPKFIDDYIKGPRDAPLAPVRPTIYKVDR
jgi:hypothetical protein